MPRFKQVQKVNTSLHLLTSGLARINFHWHLNVSWDDPSRLLSGLLSNVPFCSRTGTALRCDPLGLAHQPRRCSSKLGLGWRLCWNGITTQLSRAVPSPDWKVGKSLSLSRADHCWAAARLGAVCQTSRSPVCANSQSFPTFSRMDDIPGNFALWQWCGWWQPKHRPEPDCSEQSRETWGIWNLKPHNLFRTTFLGEFL